MHCGIAMEDTLTRAVYAIAGERPASGGRSQDLQTRETGFGVQVSDLPVTGLTPVATVQFIFLWRATDIWQKPDHGMPITQ